jgi:hypothetical protein
VDQAEGGEAIKPEATQRMHRNALKGAEGNAGWIKAGDLKAVTELAGKGLTAQREANAESN